MPPKNSQKKPHGKSLFCQKLVDTFLVVDTNEIFIFESAPSEDIMPWSKPLTRVL